MIYAEHAARVASSREEGMRREGGRTGREAVASCEGETGRVPEVRGREGGNGANADDETGEARPHYSSPMRRARVRTDVSKEERRGSNASGKADSLRRRGATLLKWAAREQFVASKAVRRRRAAANVDAAAAASVAWVEAAERCRASRSVAIVGAISGGEGCAASRGVRGGTGSMGRARVRAGVEGVEV